MQPPTLPKAALILIPRWSTLQIPKQAGEIESFSHLSDHRQGHVDLPALDHPHVRSVYPTHFAESLP